MEIKETVILNSQKPLSIGKFELKSKEYCQYLYLPIFFQESPWDMYVEPRLNFLSDMVYAAVLDFKQTYGNEFLIGNYLYLTVKQTFIAKDTHHNRPGFHSDGFETEDVQYIFFDKFPTEFLIGEYEVPVDDELSMKAFDEYARIAARDGNTEAFYQPEPYHLYRIDRHNIHRTTPAFSDGVRTFVKITFSKHRYAQEGNSYNYSAPDYDWDLKPRSVDRNQPHAK